MCRFTRIVWTECTHATLSTTPEHTQLCGIARDMCDPELRQGFDRAPAFCHALPDDLEDIGEKFDSDAVAQSICVYALCETCKASTGLSCEPHGAGTQIEQPVELFDEYSDAEHMGVTRWREQLCDDAQKAERAMHRFAALRASSEMITAGIESVRHATIRSALLDDGPERWSLCRKSHREIARLLAVLENYMAMRMPRQFCTELLEAVSNKMHQADVRLGLLEQLLDSLEGYAVDPSVHEAALDRDAERLAVRLGHEVVPDGEAFAHLTDDVPAYVQRAIAVRESVRRRSVEEHASVITDPYVPRSAFGVGRNKNALTVDIDRAWKPTPDEAVNLPALKELGERVCVMYDAELETRETLGPLDVGSGPWGYKHVLEQYEFEHDEDTLVDSPGRLEKRTSLSEVKVQTVSEGATFMGLPLEDTDSEVSDTEQGADGKDADGQDSVLKTEDDGWKRDDNGRLVKKRKCST